MRIDLHTHSTMSDGTDSPAGVMRAASAARLDVVSLTDHDTLAGWDEAEVEAASLGLRFVPGVEVSSTSRGVSVHLLAYWPRSDDAEFLAMMARTRDERVGRAREIVRRVSRDYPITWDEVSTRAESAQTVGRPHIADALVSTGVMRDRDTAFREVLHDGSPYYVPHYAPGALDVIRTVRAGGGVPAFAHPGADMRGRVVPTKAIEFMARAGLVGIEVEHRDHSERQRERLSRIAERLGLVPLGASDYHGTGKRNQLGENLTEPKALAALEAARS